MSQPRFQPTKQLPIQFRCFSTSVRRSYFSFIASWGEVIPLGTSATIWIMYQHQMMDDDECAAVGTIIGWGGGEVRGWNLLHYYCVHHKSHTTLPGVEPWETCDWPPEIWHGHCAEANKAWSFTFMPARCIHGVEFPDMIDFYLFTFPDICFESTEDITEDLCQCTMLHALIWTGYTLPLCWLELCSLKAFAFIFM
jgi:hypothetical protein